MPLIAFGVSWLKAAMLHFSFRKRSHMPPGVKRAKMYGIARFDGQHRWEVAREASMQSSSLRLNSVDGHAFSPDRKSFDTPKKGIRRQPLHYTISSTGL